MGELTSYEREQLSLIRKWENQNPPVMDKSGNIIFTAIAELESRHFFKSYIGEDGLSLFLDIIELDIDKILQELEVENFGKLRQMDLEGCDKLVQKVNNWTKEISHIELPMIPMDFRYMPIRLISCLNLAYRAMQRIALCYGYDGKSLKDKMYMNFILSAVCANSKQEKLRSLSGIRQINLLGAKGFKDEELKIIWSSVFNKIFLSQLRKNLLKRGLFSREFVLHFEIRYWNLISEIVEVAQYVFQKRWLIDKGTIGVE